MRAVGRFIRSPVRVIAGALDEAPGPYRPADAVFWLGAALCAAYIVAVIISVHA